MTNEKNKQTITKAYKVLECKNNEPHFMFHGINGAKRIPLNQTLKCEKKLVRDGTGKRWYKSGFHVYLHRDVLDKFLKSLKKNRSARFVVEVWAINPRRKHERSRAHLTDELIVTKKAWKNRKSIG